MLAAIVQSLTLLVSGSLEAGVASMTPREKAEAVPPHRGQRRLN